MKTNSNKKINPIDYEGDMARLCEKIRMGNDDYEFIIKEVVGRRTVDLRVGTLPIGSRYGNKQILITGVWD
jgi:hypothetical protein